MQKIVAQFLIFVVISAWLTLFYILESPENIGNDFHCFTNRPVWNKILYVCSAFLGTWSGWLLYEMHLHLKDFEKKQQIIGISLIELRAQKIQMERLTSILKNVFDDNINNRNKKKEFIQRKSSHKVYSCKKQPKFFPRFTQNWFPDDDDQNNNPKPPLDDGVVVLYKKESNPSLLSNTFTVSKTLAVAKVAASGLQKLVIHIGKFVVGVGKFFVLFYATETMLGGGGAGKKCRQSGKAIKKNKKEMGDQREEDNNEQQQVDEEKECLTESLKRNFLCAKTIVMQRLQTAVDSIKSPT